MILIILHTNQFNKLREDIKASGASGFCSVLIYAFKIPTFLFPSLEVLSSVGNLQI